MTNKESLSIIKIGGNVVDNPDALKSFLNDLNKLEGRKLLVHGGGVMASKMAKELGIETKMIDGRRVTDADTLRTVTMVYAGWINKSIVSALQAIGCNAIGLSGADANTIPSVRRSPEPIDFGYVGDPNPNKINDKFISQLVESGLTPVFCAITHDEKGALLNTNADTVANTLAAAMSKSYKTTLYYCFEKEGVLRDIDNPESLIKTITKEEAEALKIEGVIAGGMIPKIDNSFKAIDGGVSEVVILHADNLLAKRGTVLL
ncbi:MAG: acetylglutamate kinase [Proteiniphilum sp.]|nr:acetylglutamate kinase [Proteiniphilum sp.]